MRLPVLAVVARATAAVHAAMTEPGAIVLPHVLKYSAPAITRRLAQLALRARLAAMPCRRLSSTSGSAPGSA